jgi:hypothetical protein
MKTYMRVIPVVGLLSTVAVAGYMVVQLDGQSSTVSTRDFTNAAIAEIRDAQGRTVLHGKFVPMDEEDDDLERKATLATTGWDADAAGEAEIEYAKVAPQEQEIEFTARNLEAGATLTLVVDGVDVATATADSRGRAEAEVIVRMPGAPASR